MEPGELAADNKAPIGARTNGDFSAAKGHSVVTEERVLLGLISNTDLLLTLAHGLKGGPQ